MSTFPWKNMNVIPFADLEGWHMHEPGVSTNRLAKDYSGKGRDIQSALLNQPTLTANVLNGQSGWYFNGTATVPMQWSGSVNIKHAFVVCSADEATTTQYRGLLSGITTGDILTLNITSNLFYDFSASAFRKADVSYAANAQAGPMSGSFAVIEIIYNAGVAMDGLQVGLQRNQAGRIWKGYWLENICYSAIKNDFERLRIYQYLAMRYYLWQQKTAGGLDVFPFAANKARSSELEQEHFLSEPYSGTPAALVRGDDKRAFTLPFTTRTQAEYEATEEFHKTHFPVTHFNFRDFRFYPARDSECMITSPLREQGSEVSFRFNYAFDVAETS